MRIGPTFLMVLTTLFLFLPHAHSHNPYAYKRITTQSEFTTTKARYFLSRIRDKAIPLALSHNLNLPLDHRLHVSEQDYNCVVSALYNLTCDQTWEAFKPHHETFVQKTMQHHDSEAPFSIEPMTHRMWLTSPEFPVEVPDLRLQNYDSSLHLYGKDFTHHFWCNDQKLIPQTIATIKKFSTPVIIHELSEIIEGFVTRKLYERFLEAGMFAFASNLARQEILLQTGGLYLDIGILELRNFESYFKQYTWVQFVVNPVMPEQKVENASQIVWLDKQFFLGDSLIGAQKNSKLLNESLQLINEIPKIVRQIKHLYSPVGTTMLTTRRTWSLALALQEPTDEKIGFIYRYFDVNLLGFGSWWKLAEKLADYLNGIFEEDYQTQDNPHGSELKIAESL